MLTGVILAGGKNSRMGGNAKAMLPFPLRPIIELQLAEMAKRCDEVIVIANDADMLAPSVGKRARIIPDIRPGLGPLGGLLTALSAAHSDAVWLVACDMPCLSANAADYMLQRLLSEGGQTVVPAENGLLHPLHAIYTADCSAVAERQLSEGRLSMMGLLSAVKRVEITPEEFGRIGIGFHFTANINTPHEYEQALPDVAHGMRFVRNTLTVEEAQRKIAPFIRMTESERVPLMDSFGRFIAAPVAAPHPVPHFRRSGYDGYAVRAEDTVGASPDTPVRLNVVESIPCGSLPTTPIVPGTASRIMTGAAVPESADAVIMLEMTADDGDGDGRQVWIKKQMRSGDNIAEIGQEIAAETSLIPAGRRIRAGIAAMLAAFGYQDVEVRRKPKVAVFATGSELLEIGDQLRDGMIRNSNSYMLAALIRQAGGDAFVQSVLGDDIAAVMQSLMGAIEQYDLVVTTGGVSVGDHDVMVDFFNRWDGTLLFNKVAMRPGSPTSAGVRNGKLIFALSGNPSAGFVGFELFVRPAINGMLGISNSLPQLQTAKLAARFDKPSPYPRYVRGVHRNVGGHIYVEPVGPDQSGVTVSLIDATCLIVVPAGGRGLKEEDEVKYIPL